MLGQGSEKEGTSEDEGGDRAAICGTETAQEAMVRDLWTMHNLNPHDITSALKMLRCLQFTTQL